MPDINTVLFVYGLLRSDMSAGLQSFVPGKARLLGRATVGGRLYDLEDFPGLVLDGSGSRVLGEVWEVTDVLAWPVLDEFEDVRLEGTGLYRREAIEAVLEDGRQVLAQAYLYNRAVDGLILVASGDWARRQTNQVGTDHAS